jgi:hypothetical protein
MQPARRVCRARCILIKIFNVSFISNGNLLVVKNDVRQPDVFRGHVELGDTAVLGRVPPEFVVLPLLRSRNIGNQLKCRSISD